MLKQYDIEPAELELPGYLRRTMLCYLTAVGQLSAEEFHHSGRLLGQRTPERFKGGERFVFHARTYRQLRRLHAYLKGRPSVQSLEVTTSYVYYPTHASEGSHGT